MRAEVCFPVGALALAGGGFLVGLPVVAGFDVEAGEPGAEDGSGVDAGGEAAVVDEAVLVSGVAADDFLAGRVWTDVVEAFPEKNFVGLFIEWPVGIDAGVDEDVVRRDKHAFSFFEEIPMIVGDVLPPIAFDGGVVKCEGGAASGETPTRGDGFVKTGRKHEDFVIAAEEGAAMAFAEVDEELDDAA